jgi:hypothetical protein
MDIAWLLGRISPIVFFQPGAVNGQRFGGGHDRSTFLCQKTASA